SQRVGLFVIKTLTKLLLKKCPTSCQSLSVTPSCMLCRDLDKLWQLIGQRTPYFIVSGRRASGMYNSSKNDCGAQPRGQVLDYVCPLDCAPDSHDFHFGLVSRLAKLKFAVNRNSTEPDAALVALNHL